MKIVQEKTGEEIFLEIRLREKDLEELQEFKVISLLCEVEGIEINVGVALGDELYDDDEFWT